VRRRPLFAALAAAVTLVSALAVLTNAGATGRAARDVSAYEGLGTWVDIFDGPVLAQPAATARAMAARGIRTVYVETANYRQKVDVVAAAPLARFVEAVHDQGLRAVAWYLPGFQNLSLDLRRALAAIRFRTPRGDSFDGFALDIEAAVVKPALRTKRLLTLSRRLRSEVGEATLGAIVPSPRGMELVPKYWPRFPWPELGGLYDVFLPMTYFTYRFEGPDAAYGYLARSLAIIRQATGDPDVPVHLVGGVADKTDTAEAEAFVQLVVDDGQVTGWSLYDWATTTSAVWKELSALGSG
jgi:hypothetical protein